MLIYEYKEGSIEYRNLYIFRKDKEALNKSPFIFLVIIQMACAYNRNTILGLIEYQSFYRGAGLTAGSLFFDLSII